MTDPDPAGATCSCRPMSSRRPFPAPAPSDTRPLRHKASSVSHLVHPGALQPDIADGVEEELDVINHVLVGTPTRPGPPGLNLRHATMERVPEVLQLPIEIESRGPLPLEPQPLEQPNLLRGGGAAE